MTDDGHTRHITLSIENASKSVGVNVSNATRTLDVNVTGSAMIRRVVEADKLRTPRIIQLTGEASGETQFDGTEDVELYTSIAAMSNSELEEMLQ